MTVMFADLVDSTVMAQRHEVEVVRDVTRRYQEVAAGAIEARGGYLAQYAGDGVLAYFGFPAAKEDDARRAVMAALEMRDKIRELADVVRTELGVELRARIGLNTGVVLQGDMGSPDAPDRDAIVGLTPNQAARIQTVAPAGEVAISEATAAVVRGYFEMESLGRPRMKGIEQEVEIFRVIRPTRAVDRLQAAGPNLTPLVGRQHELDVVHEVWNSLGTDGAECAVQTLLVRGDAGIGKSRIAQELVHDVLDGRHAVFAATCAPDRSSSPLFPIIQMLDAYFGSDAHHDDGPRLAAIERACNDAGLAPEAVSLFAELLGVAPGAGYEPLQLSSQARRERIFDAINALVTVAAREQPALVVIEDVHWADRTSLELLTSLTAGRPLTGVLVAVTARPMFTSSWRGACHTTLDLGPLPAVDHEALIRTLAGMYDIAEDFWGTIAKRSDGNPLFTEELAKAIGDGTDAAVAVDTIPSTIRDLLTARLDALGDNKRLAQLAAVIGRDVDFELLQDVVGGSRRQVSAGLDALVAAGIMDAHHSGGAVTYRFVHALVRDAAYDSQERLHDRRDAHLRIARAMVDQNVSDAGIVAQHFDRADHVGEATTYYVLAATNAQDAAADVEAIGYLDRALELTTRLPEGPERDVGELNIRILRGLSNVSLQGWGAPAAAEDYGRGLELSERVGTDIALFPATAGIWAHYAVHGDLRAAGEAVDRLTAMMQPEVDAEILACTGVQRFFEGRFADARDALEHAVALFARRPEDAKMSPRWRLPNDPLTATLTHLAALLWIVGESASSADVFEQANERASNLPFPIGPFSEGYSTSYAAWVANLAGWFELGRDRYQRTREIGDRYGLAFWTAVGTVGAAISDGNLGSAAAAVAVLEPAIEQFRALGAEAFVPCYRTQLAEIRLGIGELDAALHDVDQAHEQAARTGENFFSAESHRVRAAILRRREPAEMEGAFAELAAAQRLAADQGALIFELRAVLDEVELRTGAEREQCVARLAELVARCPDGCAGADLDRARSLLDASV
jgi:class 3 adenylate cyclase/predicted ATPase/DNA-binding transcriptional ArsR family regulator